MEKFVEISGRYDVEHAPALRVPPVPLGGGLAAENTSESTCCALGVEMSPPMFPPPPRPVNRESWAFVLSEACCCLRSLGLGCSQLGFKRWTSRPTMRRVHRRVPRRVVHGRRRGVRCRRPGLPSERGGLLGPLSASYLAHFSSFATSLGVCSAARAPRVVAQWGARVSEFE